MAALEADDADLVTLDSGLAYFAGRQHNLLPLMAEDYGYQGNGRSALRDWLGVDVSRLDLSVAITL